MFSTDAYPDPLNKNRAMMIYVIILIMFLLFTVYVLFIPMMDDQTLFQKSQHNLFNLVGVVLFYITTIATYFGIRTGYWNIASWGPIAMWFFIAHYHTIPFGYINSTQGAELIMMVTIGGLVKGRRGTVVAMFLSFFALFIGILMRPLMPADSLPPYISSVEAVVDSGIANAIALFLMVFGSGILTYLYIYLNSLMRMEGATTAVEDRMLTAEVLTQIAQKVSERVALKELLDDIIDRINAKFDFLYHVQIFLVDDTGSEARLVASTGVIGQQLLDRGHKLLVGSISVVGQVASRGHLAVARADMPDTIHRQNTLLPETKVEAAFPLQIGDRIIGVLDVQSKFLEAFSDGSLLLTFQAMADSISLAVDNVSQFERAETRLRENQRLVEEAREALREVERLNERLTGRVWGEYLKGSVEQIGAEIDFETQEKSHDVPLTATLQEALQINQLVQEQRGDTQVIAIPLRVRGYVIGAMEFELDHDNPFSPEDFDLVQEVSERFGMAVENARLVDESQRLAQREALVNQITSRLQTTNNVDTMLNDAAMSLRDSLNASKVIIRLGTPPSNNGGSSS